MQLTMIQHISFAIVLSFSSIMTMYSQVGINTTEPTATLDVNGTIRVRSIPSSTADGKILVIDDSGNISSNSTLVPKSFLKVTGGSEIAILAVTLLTNWNKIAFNQVQFDENNEYNPTNYEFVAKQSGVYIVYAQYKISSLVSALDVGLGVFKRTSGSTTYTLEADETYSNVSINLALATIDVSPPTRQVQTLVKLNMGDAITFGTRGLLTSLKLLGGAKSYFTIYQVK